jgi:DNA-binding CsgD family transcriptional regulator
MRLLNNFSTIKNLIIILNLCFISILHAQQFKTYNDYDLVPRKTSSDSIFKILSDYHKVALIKNDTVNTIKSLISLSAYQRINLNYSAAFNNSGEALFIAEEFQDTLLMANAHEEFGVLSYLFKQDNEAGINFKKAHQYYKAAFKNNQIELSSLYQSHYNLVLYYQRILNEKLLRAHIDTCSTLTKKDAIYHVYLNEKKASLSEWENKDQDAIQLLNNSATALENLSEDSESAAIHKSFLIIVYGRLANIYMQLGQLRLAKQYFEKSINIKDINGEHTFYKSFIYLRYSLLLKRLNDFETAYKNLLLSNTINDTYLNPRNDNNQGFLTIKNRYKDELDRKNSLLNQKELQLAERVQELLRFRILFFVIIFLIIIISLIVRSRIKLLKYQKKERSSQELIDIKNEELTASTLQLIEREKVVKKLSDHIKKSDLDNSTKSLLKSIENRSLSLWDSFNNRFISQNEGFYERLQEKVPDLSSADLKICALIKLNFSGKEMAYLLGISLGSVHVARHRLRKKMLLDRNKNLTNFINSI